MQVIYAAPFILLSLLGFVCALALPKFRPYAFRALVAPVAFGFCSIVAMMLILAASHGLGFEFANAPLTGIRGVFEGIAIYFFPGLIGAWIAVSIVRLVETRLLHTKARRNWAIRTIAALIVFGPVFILSVGGLMGVSHKAEEWWPLTLVASVAIAGVVSVAIYVLIRALQQRVRAELW